MRPIGTTGKSLRIFRNGVKPGKQKYSAFVLTQIIGITPLVSRQMRGARDRHERAVRCDGRRWRDRRTRTAKSCGSGASVLALSPREAKLLGDDGGKKAVLREEHEVSRKAIAQGRPECSRCPVCSCAILFAQIARETAGAASTRSSLRPLFRGGPNEDASLGRNAPRDREVISTSLRGAKRRSNPSIPALRYGLLRFARNDGEGGAAVSKGAGQPAGLPRSRAWNPDPGPRNRPACLDLPQPDSPLVT